MSTVGVRLLQQHASQALRRVRQGETLTVTDRGRPIAVITPATDASTIERLCQAGRLTKAEGDVLDLPPLRLPRGAKPPSRHLHEMRQAER
jgi:prevent-host-death family protein